MADASPMEQARAWFATIPPITRYLFVGTLAITGTSAAGWISPLQVLLLPARLGGPHWELWRLVTAFLWHQLGMSFLLSLYFLYRQSSDLETDVYGGRTADYAWFLLRAMLLLDVAGAYMGSVMLAEPLLMCIVYMWSMCNLDQSVSFMFGVRFKAVYLPWVLVALDVLMGGPLSMEKLAGIAVGHVLYFTERIFPASEGGFPVLPTPGFLHAAFPADPGAPTNPGGAPGRAGGEDAAARARRAWAGGGRRLGG